jgi:hypothetical protein
VIELSDHGSSRNTGVLAVFAGLFFLGLFVAVPLLSLVSGADSRRLDTRDHRASWPGTSR